MTKATPRYIAEVAPTLADLKRLPLAQSRLLRARLAVIYPQVQSAGGLHKGNLLLPNDPFGLAAGYSHAENSEVRRHLLGAPWTTLVNQGYIVDPEGKGFYSVSDEGYEALQDAQPPASPHTGGPMGNSALQNGSGSHRMPRTAIVLNVLIASPSDVGEERDIITSAAHGWNAAHYSTTGIMLNPIRWETHSFPASGDRPQAIVNRQIVDEGDFLIAVFGYRLGTPTGEAQSGTIEEIERFRRAGKHVALYFSTADVPRDADRDQLKALEGYQTERRKDTLYSTFGSSEELRQLVSQHLPHIVSEVHKSLRSSHQLEGLEEELRRTEVRAERRLSKLASGTRDEFRNPQIKAEFIGEYPEGPTLWITADREIYLSQLDYLDLHEAKVDSDRLELAGQDFRIPVDHAKLVKINNLMHGDGRPFRMKFRAEITFNGRAISHVIPVIVEPAMKPIEGAVTLFMRIVGSTGYAL